MLTCARYKKRLWAVYESEELLCVTVYRKGALAVIERITRGAPEGRTEHTERPEPRDSIRSTHNERESGAGET